MAQSLLNEPMPQWLRRALRKQVLTWPEAQALHHSSLMCPPWESWNPLPEALWPAAARISLLETPTLGGQQ